MNLQESIKKILREEVSEDKNLYGEKLKACSTKPMTGFYRDGYCRTGNNDTGSHTVCARVTEEFLEFTKSMGNNLDMLEPGDKWCLCAKRWEEANKEGVEPEMIKSSTNIKTLDIIDSVEQELDEYARTLKNARRQGVGLRFPKSAVRANPQRFRKYTRDNIKESENKSEDKKLKLVKLIEKDGLYNFIEMTGLDFNQVRSLLKQIDNPKEILKQYIREFVLEKGGVSGENYGSLFGLKIRLSNTKLINDIMVQDSDQIAVEIWEFYEDNYGQRITKDQYLTSINTLTNEELLSILSWMMETIKFGYWD
jgi:uncharacterized protein (DUF2237 family)